MRASRSPLLTLGAVAGLALVACAPPAPSPLPSPPPTPRIDQETPTMRRMPTELPDWDRDGFELESGEDRHAEDPDTFRIPDAAERHALEVGALAKLIFRIKVRNDAEAASVERMWVEVIDVLEGGDDPVYIGRLDNDPAGRVDLKADTLLRFAPKHVIGIYGD